MIKDILGYLEPKLKFELEEYIREHKEREIEEREDSIKEQLRRGKKALNKGVDG